MPALVLLLMAGTSPFVGEVPKNLAITGHLVMVRSLRAIPEPVRGAFLTAIKADKTYGVADPSDEWYGGCSIGPDNPLHQLVYAASIPPFWIVAFRHGGFFSGEGLYVFQLQQGRVEKSWSDLRLPYGESSKDFIARLQRGDICFVSPPRLFYYAEERDECVRHGT